MVVGSGPVHSVGAAVVVSDAMMALGCLKPIPRPLGPSTKQCLLLGGPPTSGAETENAVQAYAVACFRRNVARRSPGGEGEVEVLLKSSSDE